MRKLYCLFVILLFSIDCFCQEIADGYFKGYRIESSTPPYGIKKVKLLLATIEKEITKNRLSKKDYESLSLREKFTYNIIHGETFMQNCSAVMIDSDASKKIYAHLLSISDFSMYGWGDNQRKFFITNRDSVSFLIKECVGKTNKIGLNFKQAIWIIDGKEMIPFLINSYASNTNDHDILTLIMLLMKDNDYKPFLSSDIFNKLYGAESNYSTYISFNKQAIASIVKYAMQFCKDNNIK